MAISLSHRIDDLAHACEGRQNLTLKEVLDLIGPKAQALITLSFSLPFVVLLPAPGLSILFGAIIFINGLRIARKKPIWIPKKLHEKKLSGDLFAKNLRKTLPFLKWLEKFIRPRGVIYQQNSFIQVINGSFLALGGFLLFLPLPPGTNFLPGLATFFLSLGVLEEDFLMLWIGYLLFLINCIAYIFIPIFLVQ